MHGTQLMIMTRREISSQNNKYESLDLFGKPDITDIDL